MPADRRGTSAPQHRQAPLPSFKVARYRRAPLRRRFPAFGGLRRTTVAACDIRMARPSLRLEIQHHAERRPNGRLMSRERVSRGASRPTDWVTTAACSRNGALRICPGSGEAAACRKSVKGTGSNRCGWLRSTAGSPRSEPAALPASVAALDRCVPTGSACSMRAIAAAVLERWTWARPSARLRPAPSQAMAPRIRFGRPARQTDFQMTFNHAAQRQVFSAVQHG